MILRVKAFWTVVGAWILGLPVGLVAATIYDRIMYDPEPDPVRFDVGGVFLLGWLLVGVAGTALAINNHLKSR